MSARIPDELHKLKGSRPTRADKPDFQVPESRPRKPKDLEPEAMAIFTRLCSLLKKRRHLTAGDGELCRLYAITHVRHAKALARLAAEGEIRFYTRLDASGIAREIEKENLWLKVAFVCEKNMTSILDRLGLCPLNRSKVKTTAPVVPDTPMDPMEELLSRARNSKDAWVLPPTTEEPDDDDEQPRNGN